VLFVELRVVDTDGNEVPAGELGEVVYRSPQLCEGTGTTRGTEEAFTGGWFHSGDLVRATSRATSPCGPDQGCDQHRRCAGGLPGGGGRAVQPPGGGRGGGDRTPDDRWIEAITAFVVVKGADPVDPADLIAYTKTRLAGFKVPKKVLLVDELPATPPASCSSGCCGNQLEA